MDDLQAPEKLFYANVDDERFTCESLEEYIVEQFDDWRDWGDTDATPESFAREMAPMTVHIFTPEVVDDRWVKRMGDALVLQFEEQWGDDFGDPDGFTESIGSDLRRKLEEQAAVVVKIWTNQLQPWRCKEHSKTVVSEELIVSILREAA